MKKLLCFMGILAVIGCASEQMKPDVVQSKMAVGLTAADVISTLGMPDEKRVGEEKGSLELNYPGYTLSFIDGTLATAKASSPEGPTDLPLRPVEENYKPDAIALNPSAKISPYQIAGFLEDETLFLKALEAKINPNGFTVHSNALCVALAEGFVKGTEKLLEYGYNPDIQMRSDKGIYIFPPDCLRFQKNPELALKLKAMVDADTKANAKSAPLGPALHGATDTGTAVSGTTVSGTSTVQPKKEYSKPAIDWQEVKDFLKPDLPPVKSNIDR